jgi:hypothetical protein
MALGSYMLLRNAGPANGADEAQEKQGLGKGGDPPSPQQPFSLSDCAAKVRRSIVVIAVERADGSRRFGSGVVVRNDGIVATSCQLVDKATTITVMLRDKRRKSVVGTLARDQATSLALLDMGADCHAVTIASDLPQRGNPVGAVILSHELKIKAVRATIAAECTGTEVIERLGTRSVGLSPDVDWFQVEASESTTASQDALLSGRGEPLFNRRGELVGLCTFTLENGRTTQYGICSKYITGLIQKNDGLLEPTDNGNEPLARPGRGAAPPPDRGIGQQSDTALASGSFKLDLSRPVMMIELGDHVPRDAVVAVEEINALDTPYVMSPADGIIRENQPVDVELTGFRAAFKQVSIRLSLKWRAGALQLRAEGRIDAGLKTPLSLTREGLQRLYRLSNTQFKRLGQQLTGAKSRRAQIEAAFVSRRMMPVATRQAMIAELNLLIQRIPTLENSWAVARRDAAAIQELSGVAEQINGKTEIVYRVRVVEKVPLRHGASNGAPAAQVPQLSDIERPTTHNVDIDSGPEAPADAKFSSTAGESTERPLCVPSRRPTCTRWATARCASGADCMQVRCSTTGKSPYVTPSPRRGQTCQPRASDRESCERSRRPGLAIQSIPEALKGRNNRHGPERRFPDAQRRVIDAAFPRCAAFVLVANCSGLRIDVCLVRPLLRPFRALR